MHGNPFFESESALTRCYERLLTTLFAAARERGYVGDDPLVALGLINSPPSDLLRCTEAIAELWLRSVKDPDHPLAQRLADQRPDLGLAYDLAVDLLSRQSRQRHNSVAEALNEDQAQSLGRLLAVALEEMGETQLEGLAPHRLLSLLVRRYRAELLRLREQADMAQQRLLRVLTALERVALGQSCDLTELGDEAAIIQTLGEMLTSREALAQRARSAEESLLACQQENDGLRRECSDLQTELARSQAEGSEDERLQLYRQAFALLEAGKDPLPLLDTIRDKERVFIAPQAQKEEVQRLLLRAIENAVQYLSSLRRIIPLGNDVRVYKPRLLGRSSYDFRSLPGLLAVARDIAKDVCAFAKHLYIAQGLRNLGAALHQLRPAMQEMVRLVADCREQSKDRVTLSLTVSLDSTSGLSSLPALLARDLESLSRSRHGRAYAQDLLELSQELISAYHQALEEACGDIPALPKAKTRSKAPRLLAQWSEHLRVLAQQQEAVFAQVGGRSFEPGAAEMALIADRDLLRRSSAELATMIQIVSQLPGAPSRAELTPPPDFDSPDRRSWLDSLEATADWLCEAARYRCP